MSSLGIMMKPEKLERVKVEVIIDSFAKANKEKKNSLNLNVFYTNFHKIDNLYTI
jgi:hypothetical protein